MLSLCPTAPLATRSSARATHSFEPVHTRSLPTIALYTSSFYAAWAVRNYLSGNTRERGMVTFGTLAAGAALCNHGHPLWGARVAGGALAECQARARLAQDGGLGTCVQGAPRLAHADDGLFRVGVCHRRLVLCRE